MQPIAARQWSAGILPSKFQGVKFNSVGDPVSVHRRTRAASAPTMQSDSIDAINALNRLADSTLHDPEIQTRIAQYEMAFRMQTSVPGPGGHEQRAEDACSRCTARKPGDGSFASNCLLARRLAERGVRFIQLYHRDWDHHGGVKTGIGLQGRGSRPADGGADHRPEAARHARRHAGDLGRRVRAHADVAGRRRPRPSHQGVLVHAGRRRHQGRHHLRRDRRAGLRRRRRIRSASTISTRRCCTCSASITSGWP